MITKLGDQSGGSGRFVFPGRRQNTNSLVVTRQAMNPGLDENEAELAVLVLAVALKVLSHGDSLLDKHVEIFRNLWCEAFSLSVHEPSRGFALLFFFLFFPHFPAHRRTTELIDRPIFHECRGFDFI